jgi:hypothetical protein
MSASKRCNVCGSETEMGALRCHCGSLFLDAVLRLPADKAESLLASNRAWLDHERTRGRRQLVQGFGLGLFPGLITLGAAISGSLVALLVFGTIFGGLASWGYRGARRASLAKRIAAANRIALPAARIHSDGG